MDWQISGHKQQLEFLEKALAKGNLAHGLLFAGPSGMGKKMIALKLATMLVGSTEETNPDLLFVDGSLGTIKIEQVRDLIYKLSLKPYAAQYKVAIIDSAENMTDEAANALLKSLEEPKERTVIFLISSNPNRMPKTILSRCQKINFGIVPGREPQADQTDRFSIFAGKDLVGKLLLAQELAELEPPELKQVLGSWLIRLEQGLRQNPSQTTKTATTQVALTQRYLDQNLNTKLLLTNLMLNT